jgi:hypothetical protein
MWKDEKLGFNFLIFLKVILESVRLLLIITFNYV